MELQTVSVQEAARALGVGRCVGYKLAHAGVIPTLRLGRKLRVSRPALEAMLRNPQGERKGA
ncbi:MAG: excisionase family DNA-binding protein [Armatimonadota bacterium]